MAPDLGAFESAAPDATACVARFSLGVEILVRVSPVIHRIAIAHERFAEIGNLAGRAGRERAAIAVSALGDAGNLPVRDKRDQPRSRRTPA